MCPFETKAFSFSFSFFSLSSYEAHPSNREFTSCCQPVAERLEASDEQRLFRKLMKNYEKSVRPVINSSMPVVVSLGITLTQILDIVSILRMYPKQIHIQPRGPYGNTTGYRRLHRKGPSALQNQPSCTFVTCNQEVPRKFLAPPTQAYYQYAGHQLASKGIAVNLQLGKCYNEGCQATSIYCCSRNS